MAATRALKTPISECGVTASRFGAVGLALIVLLSACATARIEQAKHLHTRIFDGEAVVVLPRRQHGGRGAEQSFMECLNGTLTRGDSSMQLYPEQAFVDELFPWFEPRTAPATPEALLSVLNQPGVAQKLEDARVRYLVWVDGNTEEVDRGGTLSCAVGPGGGGCLGFMWWEKDSSYEAVIWDLKQGESVGSISTDVSGTSYLPALIIPVPLLARTEAAACKGLAQQLKELMGVTEDDTHRADEL